MMQFFLRQHSYRNASLIVLVSSASWGVLWVPIRYAESLGLSAMWVQFMFMAVPVLVLVPFTLRSTIANREHWPIYLAAGFLIGAGFVCYALGLLLGSVSKTTALFYLVPVWSTLLGLVFLGERADTRRWLLIASALAGCFLVMQINPASLGVEPVDLFGVMSAILWGGGVVVLRRFPQADFRNTTLVQYVSGSLILIVAILVLGDPAPTPRAAMAALPLAFIFGAMVFLPTMMIIIRISQYLSPGLVGILMLTEILVAVVTAAIFLGETLDAMQWTGIALILLAGVGVAFAPSREMQSAKAD